MMTLALSTTTWVERGGGVTADAAAAAARILLGEPLSVEGGSGWGGGWEMAAVTQP